VIQPFSDCPMQSPYPGSQDGTHYTVCKAVHGRIQSAEYDRERVPNEQSDGNVIRRFGDAFVRVGNMDQMVYVGEEVKRDGDAIC
jgi:hypothetical protein